LSRISSLLGRAALASLLGAGAVVATAEDFEFSVPVQLSKLDPALMQGTVECEVLGVGQHGNGGAGQASSTGSSFLGWGSTSFPIAQGKFNDTVLVKFNLNRPTIPSDGRSWRCTLSLGSGGGTFPFPLCNEQPAAGSGMVTGKPIPAAMKLDQKTLKACVHGTISPPR
jgi:hypothetical protein